MKMIYPVLCVLCLFFVSCGGETEVSFEFVVNNREVTISKMKGRSKNITVPSTINGMPVVGFYSDYSVFQGKGIERITLPNTLTSLGGLRDNKLTSITIPNSVKVIGDNALMNNKLTSITIPEGCEILANAFENNQLTSVNLPNSLREIKMGAFRNNKLTSITIPSRVREIHSSAFAKNPITSITIPDNVYLHGGAFDNNFVSYYESYGSQGGTYIYSNGSWSKR